MSIFSNIFTPTGSLPIRQREAVPGVPKTTDPADPSNQPQGAAAGSSGAEYAERIVAARSPEQACSVSAVYRATVLRADTMSVMPVQYQKRDFEGGNFVTDMRGLGRRLNYLLQEVPNPMMTASDLWKLVEINRHFFGNAFVYIERDEFDLPAQLWLVRSGGYNVNTGAYSSIVYLTDHGYETLTNVSRRDVMHFPNTFRYPNGWGVPTLHYAYETLTLNRTLRSQALETAAKGGRIKGILSEKEPSQGAGTLAFGLLNKEQMGQSAQEMQRKFYSGQDIVSMHGLESFQNLSMTSQDMQMFEQLGLTYDDVSRFWGVPRPLLMLDTNSHYNDYQNATMEFHTRTILPQKTGNEKEIAAKLIGWKDYGTRRIHICEEPLLAMDPERQAKVDQLLLQNGTKTVNEVRQSHDMPAVPDGDEPLASANLLTLRALIAKSDAATTLKPGNYTVEEPAATTDGNEPK